MSAYGLLADVVVLVHFLWIVFLFTGAVWGRKYKLVKIVHLGGLGYAVLMQVMGWYCPLTHVEFWLRRKENPLIPYGDSFIRHYVERLIYVDISPGIIFAVTIVLVTLNLIVYLRPTFKKS